MEKRSSRSKKKREVQGKVLKVLEFKRQCMLDYVQQGRCQLSSESPSVED